MVTRRTDYERNKHKIFNNKQHKKQSKNNNHNNSSKGNCDKQQPRTTKNHTTTKYTTQPQESNPTTPKIHRNKTQRPGSAMARWLKFWPRGSQPDAATQSVAIVARPFLVSNMGKCQQREDMTCHIAGWCFCCTTPWCDIACEWRANGRNSGSKPAKHPPLPHLFNQFCLSSTSVFHKSAGSECLQLSGSHRRSTTKPQAHKK